MARIVNPSPAGPTTAAQIAAFEAYIGHPLPAAYRDFLLAHNGGKPEPDAFTLRMEDGEPEENVVMCFFPLRDLPAPTDEEDEEDDDEEDDDDDEDVGGGMAALRVWPLQSAWDDLENLYELELDPPLLPIGTDGSSNYVCLVLTGDRTGAVVFLDHETAEDWPLADSLPAFLESLRPRERTDYHEEL